MSEETLPVYPWYGLVSGLELEQGDILWQCPVPEIPARAFEGGVYDVLVREQNVIILTQSCDLVVRPDGSTLIDDVILCPVYQKEELREHRIYGKNQGWEEARKGRHSGYHVLNQCDLPGQEFDFLMIDLRRVYSLSLAFVRDFASAQGVRVRLLPPYKEHLSQSFARFFMRVGLPSDIPPFR